MNLDDKIHGISTLLSCSYSHGASQGTGFFYQSLAEADPSKKDGQWRAIEALYIVTNRHVVLAKQENSEVFPNVFTFHLRKNDNGNIVWDAITLNVEELRKRAFFHPNPSVDVCVISILDLVIERMKSDTNYLNWYAVSRENFAGQNKINVDMSSEAAVIGYPRGFYDVMNKFPIIKSGKLASRHGLNFNGNPYFLIDSKLFPGSSGSVVISDPTDLVVENGNILHSDEKQFAFLGVYSGEPFQQSQPIEIDDMTIIRKSGFNVGIVWYGYLVEEIIQASINL